MTEISALARESRDFVDEYYMASYRMSPSLTIISRTCGFIINIITSVINHGKNCFV